MIHAQNSGFSSISQSYSHSLFTPLGYMAKLFYMIGSSGAGKDSIVRYVRPRLDPQAKIIFAHRYITRPDHLGSENYVYLTDQEFEIRLESGLFLMNWDANGYRFAVGNELQDWLSNGFNILIQGSRSYLPEASKILGDVLVPIMVEIDNAVLRERLLSELNSTPDKTEQIIHHNSQFSIDHPNLIRLENNGPIDLAGERLLSLFHAMALTEKQHNSIQFV
jgi:ribose 1,5-bisphosphokinase